MKNTIRYVFLLLAGLVAFTGRAQNTVAQWDFKNGDLTATVGQPLQYMGGAAAGTKFSTTTSLGLPDINGTPANVMGFPKTTPDQGYLMPVPGPIPAGSVGVNDWTLIMDVLIPGASVGNKIALLEIIDASLVSSPGAADAEFYFQGGGLSYNGNPSGTINGDTWHRIAIVSDNSNGQKIYKYIDGVKVGEQGNGGPETIDGKWALDSLGGTARLFNDDNDETAAGFVSSIQLRDRPLAPGQIFAIGGATAEGIPTVLPKVPSFPEQWIPASEFANRDAELGLVINAGDTTISDSSIVLKLNGEVKTAKITRTGASIRIALPSAGLYPAPSSQSIEIGFTDSVDGAKSFTREYTIPIFFEDFNSLPLGPNVDEASVGENVWTKTPPQGWTIDDSGVPGAGDPENDGRTEWAGWSFADALWWPTVDDQQRSQFTKASGAVAVADPDEWDDGPHLPSAENGWYNTYMTTREISLEGVSENTAFVRFDSSWRPEFDDNYHQSANIRVSFDGGEPVEILRWLSDPGSSNFKPDAVNETVVVQLNNPAGASKMTLTFGLFDAGNDWWWAIDNLIVNSGLVAPSISGEPTGLEVEIGSSASFSVEASGDQLSYQWYKGTGASRSAISGATDATLKIASASEADGDLYSVDVSNPAGTVSSAAARLVVIQSIGGRILFSEDFDGLTLGASVDEGVPGANVWTKTAPAGWTIDDSGMPGVGDPETDGVTEWAGWSFADRLWWAQTAGDQRRSEFTKSSGTAAIVDPDEWDDLPHDGGTFNSFMSTPAIDISGIEPNTAVMRFNSSFRPEGEQTATVTVSFDGGAAVEVLNYRDTSDNKTNETLDLDLMNPAGAKSMVITFGMANAGNNWFWAIDNIRVATKGDLGVAAPTITGNPPASVNAFVGETLMLSVTATGDDLNYQWFKGQAADRAAIAGATGAEFMIAQLAAEDAGVYSVTVSNPGGEVQSSETSVKVNPPPVQPGATLLFSENFNGLPLGPNVDEVVVGVNVWTKTAPAGWVADDSGVPGVGNPETDGVTEWAGWSFADAVWWATAAGDQRRTEFTLATGAVAVADADEWDDLPHADAAAAGWYDTFLSTPAISLAGIAPNSAVLKFDSSWRPEFDDNYHQTAVVNVSFDGGTPVQAMLWESDGNSANFKADAVNETVTVALNNPAGASSMVVTFGLVDAGNDWWWAFDNVEVSGTRSLFREGFEGLPLGPNMDETVVGANVWTRTAPAGWVVDASGVPGAGDPANDGVTEWAGWSFADAVWWVTAAGDQRRSEFTNASGTVAVADPDEWDDAPHADSAAAGWYDTFLTTPEISLAGVPATSAVLKFDSSWRPEFDDNYHQTASITVSYDGGTPVQVMLWESDSNSPNYKPDSVNETVMVPLNNPAGASKMVISFGLIDAGNDWWWAIDNIDVQVGKSTGPVLMALPFTENFNSLPLGPNVDEVVAGENVWTKTAPGGWVIDDSGVPGVGDPETDGVTEWAGWSFADAVWWATAAGDQRRTEFTLATGAVAVADADEWDDLPHADAAAAGWYDTFLSTPALSLAGVAANTAVLKFDSSWRPEFDDNYHQTALVNVSYDGAEPVQVMLWESDGNSPNFKPDSVNETVRVPLNNPAGASSMVVTFGLVDAGNDWWWAIDNIVVDAPAGAGQISAGRNASGQLVLAWGDSEARLQSSPSVSGPWTDVPGATSPTSINMIQSGAFYRLIK